MKFLLLLFAMILTKEIAFSQWTENENPLTLKELHLTATQQKKIKKINNTSKAEIDSLKKQNNDNNPEMQTQIDNLTGARIKNIRNCLTAEQQITWQKILMNDKPRRGVTNLPNEKATMDLSKLPAGVYIVKMVYTEKTIIDRIVKE